MYIMKIYILCRLGASGKSPFSQPEIFDQIHLLEVASVAAGADQGGCQQAGRPLSISHQNVAFREGLNLSQVVLLARSG